MSGAQQYAPPAEVMGLDVATLDQALDTIRAFGRRHLAEAGETGCDAARASDHLLGRLWDEDVGLRLFFLPEAAGGLGSDAFDVYRVCETLGWVDLELGSAVAELAAAHGSVAAGLTPLMMAGLNLGAGWSALERSILRSKEISQEASTLSKDPGLTHRFVVPQAAGLEAARAVIEETASRLTADGEPAAVDEGTTVAVHLATGAAVDATVAALRTYSVAETVKTSVIVRLQRELQITMRSHGAAGSTPASIGRRRFERHVDGGSSATRDQAGEMQALDRSSPAVGAYPAALAFQALGEILDAAGRIGAAPPLSLLTDLGNLAATAEAAAALCRRAAAAADGSLPPKTDERIDRDGLVMLSRIWARHAALCVATVGGALIGADAERLGLGEICAAQSGNLDDLDEAAYQLYRSTCQRQKHIRGTAW